MPTTTPAKKGDMQTVTTPEGAEVTQRKDSIAAQPGSVGAPTAAPAGKEERRCYQVTKKADSSGKPTGTERQMLTKKEALALGFPWAETKEE